MGNKDTEIERFQGNNLSNTMENTNIETEVKGVSRRKLADCCFKAVSACRFKKVKFLLDNGVAPHTRNDDGQNLLVAALFINDVDNRRRMVTYLLSRGVPCVGLDNKGRDVLSWACILGYPQQVQQIADAAMGNVDLQRQDKEGMTPLHHATKQGHKEVVRILINMMKRFRLSVDVQDVHGLTPYLYARRLGHNEVAEVLVNEGNASTHQFDSHQFHNADDWAIIGAAERRKRELDVKQRETALYKIRGRLPPGVRIVTVRKSIVPRIQLSADSETKVRSSCDNRANGLNSRESTSVRNGVLTSRSVDTALTLLNLRPSASPLDALMTPVSHHHRLRPITDRESPITEAQGSEEEREEEKEDENLAVTASIPTIMDILADQSCPSYRSPAAAREITQRRQLPRLQPRSRQTSTLAMVLSTNPRRSSTSHTDTSKKTHVPWK